MEKPSFEQSGGYFRITIKRRGVEKVVEKVVEKLSPNQEIIVSLIKKNPKISKREIQKESNLGKKAVDYNIEILKKNGIIKRTGPAKGGQWEVTD